jgi:hypothetical protein
MSYSQMLQHSLLLVALLKRKIHKTVSASRCHSLNDVTWPKRLCLSYPLLLMF